jgi:hypothetical protein
VEEDTLSTLANSFSLIANSRTSSTTGHAQKLADLDTKVTSHAEKLDAILEKNKSIEESLGAILRALNASTAASS